MIFFRISLEKVNFGNGILFHFFPVTVAENSWKNQMSIILYFQVENGGPKQANGSRDSFWPEAKPRVGMVGGCNLPA